MTTPDYSTAFNSFANKSWQDKVLDADLLWSQVKAGLAKSGTTLPQTLRRPDVRLIVNNISGADVTFNNPGDHSGGKQEVIPASGDKTAAMVMVKGDTLAEQYANAAKLYAEYQLDQEGLSARFVNDMQNGVLSELIAEAYGPAPLQGQAKDLEQFNWREGNALTADSFTPVHGNAASYGARPPKGEQVFIAQFYIYVKGTTTVPELVEGASMAIAIASDWKTGAETTRPIVPSVARTYYGEHFSSIPVAHVHPETGVVRDVTFAARPASPTAAPAAAADPPRKNN